MSNDVKMFVDGLKAYIQNRADARWRKFGSGAYSYDGGGEDRGLTQGLEAAIDMIDEYVDGYLGELSKHNESVSRNQKRSIDDIFVKKFMDKVIMSETKGYR